MQWSYDRRHLAHSPLDVSCVWRVGEYYDLFIPLFCIFYGLRPVCGAYFPLYRWKSGFLGVTRCNSGTKATYYDAHTIVLPPNYDATKCLPAPTLPPNSTKLVTVFLRLPRQALRLVALLLNMHSKQTTACLVSLTELPMAFPPYFVRITFPHLASSMPPTNFKMQ